MPSNKDLERANRVNLNRSRFNVLAPRFACHGERLIRDTKPLSQYLETGVFAIARGGSDGEVGDPPNNRSTIAQSVIA